MKTYFGITETGWVWAAGLAFCCACWAPVVMAVVR